MLISIIGAILLRLMRYPALPVATRIDILGTG